ILNFYYFYTHIYSILIHHFLFFFQAEDGIRDRNVTGVQTCALPISIAPVNVAISTTYSAPSSPARRRPSAKIRRPSASVFPTCRSEERRVGKECEYWLAVFNFKRNNEMNSVTTYMC